MALANPLALLRGLPCPFHSFYAGPCLAAPKVRRDSFAANCLAIPTTACALGSGFSLSYGNHSSVRRSKP